MVIISADVPESHFLFQACVRRTSEAVTYIVSIKQARKAAQTLRRPGLQRMHYNEYYGS